MPGRVTSTPMPSRDRSMNSINASLGNPDRRTPARRMPADARHATRAHRRSRNTRTRGYRGLAATPDHPSVPSVRTSQDALRRSRRCVGNVGFATPFLIDCAREALNTERRAIGLPVLRQGSRSAWRLPAVVCGAVPASKRVEKMNAGANSRRSPMRFDNGGRNHVRIFTCAHSGVRDPACLGGSAVI
jgi:hypothetical protein